jgi:hypothetical protein
MIGLVMDAALMLLLVCAVGFGVRLERRLKVLREGQLAFAGAVTELNEAAGRAEAALASLRAAGQETDLLHDRIVRARELKGELERLIARGEARTLPPLHGEGRPASAGQGGATSERAPALSHPTRAQASPSPSLPMKGRESAPPAEPADRMASLAQRIQALAGPGAGAGRDDVAAIVRAMTANPVSERNPNRAVRAQDDDLFAA